MSEECIPGCPDYVSCQYHDPNKCGKVVPCHCNGSGRRCIAGMLAIEYCPVGAVGCPEECKYNATCLSCNGRGWHFVKGIEMSVREHDDLFPDLVRLRAKWVIDP